MEELIDMKVSGPFSLGKHWPKTGTPDAQRSQDESSGGVRRYLNFLILSEGHGGVSIERKFAVE
jgi:hypothetical protein